MNKFSINIKPYVEREFAKFAINMRSGDATQAFTNLENAHVLGQESTYFHVKTHVLMLQWAVHQNQPKEVIGQIVRIIGATTKTVFGLVPIGNTGGAGVSPFRSMPLQPGHKAIITRAKTL